MNSEVDSNGWSVEIETGIDLLDEQHHWYVELLSGYFETLSAHSGADERAKQLTNSFHYLRKYAREHFSAEESIMKDVNYPNYLSHLKEHQHYVLHISKLYTQMKINGFSPELSREVNFYTVEWFIKHILEADRKLMEFLQSKHQKISDQAVTDSLRHFESRTFSPELVYELH